MNKKAQFYILAAVILLAITFGLFSAKKTIPAPQKGFDLLVNNYIKEAPFAANAANLDDFTLKFYSLAIATDPNFEMLTLNVMQGNISALSLIKSAIFINQYSLSFNQSLVFERQDSVAVSIGAQQYIINTTNTSLKAIFISQSENSRNVRLV